MGFNCGIVGLPNVGKSTLFNALTATQAAEAANYPFCTIEPNKGRVGVPDARLEAIAKIAGSAKIIPTQLEFIDIAGLVKGASKGAGKGIDFLDDIRNVDAIAHVVRCFEDSEITHEEAGVDPLRDADIIETELALADLDRLEKRIANLEKKAKGGDKETLELLAVAKPIYAAVAEGKPARTVQFDDPHQDRIAHSLQLLTYKPIMYVCNVEEASAATGNAHSAKIEEHAKKVGAACVVISAKIESEVALLESDEEKKEFLAALGLQETGLARLIRAGYGLLDLITFFTAGPKETHAWTVYKGALAPQAAGAIHTDFEKGFIRAETIAYADFVRHGGEQGAKDAGRMRLEGKEYVVQDGDIMHFRFNV